MVEGEEVEHRVVLLQRAEMGKEDDIVTMHSPSREVRNCHGTDADDVAIEIPDTAHEVSTGPLSFYPLPLCSISLFPIRFLFFCFISSVSFCWVVSESDLFLAQVFELCLWWL